MMQPQRELNTFPISGLQKGKLQNAGYIVCEDLKDISAADLSQEICISIEDAQAILDLTQTIPKGDNSPQSTGTPVSALDLLKEEQCTSSIVTFCEKIDSVIRGGIPLSKITEICGVPGVGKTQMCMQLAVDVQMPEDFGGLNGQVIFIDTEGSFIVERLVDIAKATIEDCKQLSDDKDSMKDFTVEQILSGVHYFRCLDYVELLAIVRLLPEIIKERSNVKLVIVDSVAYPFRHDFEDLYHRTRVLTKMAQNFRKIAIDFNLAVVFTNQMTTKIRHGSDSQLIPSLGETWAYCSTTRIILRWDGIIRKACLLKSPMSRGTTVPYQVTMRGIRDVIEPHVVNVNKDMGEENPTKRQRVT